MKLSAVNISNLTFSYPGQPVPILSNFDLEIAKGERFGLFGPNGAGKTTLMNLMTGLLIFETGSIQLLDVKINNHRKLANKLFGYVPQDFSFYQELSPAENLEFFGAWYGLSRQQIKLRTNELLNVLGLEDARNKPVEKFSGGMKRRVNLAIGVMHNPALLFLDEPTVGVDVQTRFAIIDYLKQLNENGTTLIYTSHQLSEAEGLCERIALIDDGKIIVNDNLDALLVKHKQIGLEGLFLNLTGKNYRDV
ncbi:ABC transporter ATP-binding protein [Mucilaginibacter sp.]|uniref:ABC transporter ATP-binding protein n=1 Tax=Mucilaginibacter sp. TaxID=1882438 RepID=UPI0032678974